MAVKVTVYESRIAAAFGRTGMVYGQVGKLARQNYNIARHLAPFQTGRMKASIGWDVQRVNQYSTKYNIYVNVDYAKFVLGGTTGPITPKKGKFLWVQPFPRSRLNWNRRTKSGRWPFKSVAGQDANNFLEDSMDDTLFFNGL